MLWTQPELLRDVAPHSGRTRLAPGPVGAITDRVLVQSTMQHVGDVRIGAEHLPALQGQQLDAGRPRAHQQRVHDDPADAPATAVRVRHDLRDLAHRHQHRARGPPQRS